MKLKFFTIFICLFVISFPILSQSIYITDIRITSYDGNEQVLDNMSQNSAHVNIQIELNSKPIYYNELSPNGKNFTAKFLNTSGRDEYFVKSINDGFIGKAIFKQLDSDYEMTIEAIESIQYHDIKTKNNPFTLIIDIYKNKSTSSNRLISTGNIAQTNIPSQNYTTPKTYLPKLKSIRSSTNKNEYSSEFNSFLDRTRIVFDLSRAVNYHLNQNSNSLIIQFEKCDYSNSTHLVNNSRVGSVIISNNQNGTVASVNLLSKYLHIKDFKLKNPDRLVVDIFSSPLSHTGFVEKTSYENIDKSGKTIYVDKNQPVSNSSVKSPQLVPDDKKYQYSMVQESEIFKDEEVEYYLFKKGSEYINNNQLSDAELVFRRIINDYPESQLVPASKFQLGVIEGKRKEIELLKEKEKLETIEKEETEFSNKLISINVKEVPILNVLKVLSKKSGYDIIASNQVTGNISISVKDKPLKSILDLIVKTNLLRYETEGKTIYVGTDEQIRYGTSTKLKIFQIEFIEAQKLKEIIDQMLPDGSVCGIDKSANKLIILAPESLLEEIKGIIDNLDQKPAQILFQTRIIELQGTIDNLGLNFNNTNDLNNLDTKLLSNSDGIKFRTFKDINSSQFEARLNFLYKSGDAKILANSKIATLNKKTAKILIGKRIPILVGQNSETGNSSQKLEYIETGIIVNITPTLTNDNEVTVTIKPEISQIVDFRNEMPIIKTREAASTLRTKDGETIFLGGLLNEENFEDVYKLPLLGDLPLIGNLFRVSAKSTRQTDLLILITPYLDYDASSEFIDNITVSYPQE